MQRFISLILHFIRIIILFSQPTGAKALIAENMKLRKQLIQLTRKNKSSHKLSFLDRLFYAVSVYFINPNRLGKSAIIIKPATIIKFQ
jgi:putative transposase